MFHRSLTALAVAALLPFAMSGCATGKKKEKVKAAPLTPKPLEIGTVKLVNEGSRFVLIDTGGAGMPEAGATLKTFTGKEQSGEVVTGEVSKPPFIIADIHEGNPKKGDRVVMVRTIEPAVVPITTVPTPSQATVVPSTSNPHPDPHAPVQIPDHSPIEPYSREQSILAPGMVQDDAPSEEGSADDQ